MCRFSETSRVRLGNVVVYIATHAKYPYKTEVLKLLFLMEERMVEKYHVPMLSIPYLVWRFGPVSVDVYAELTDGPSLLSDFVSIRNNTHGTKVIPCKEFDENEFSDAELQIMQEVMFKYGSMTSEDLIALTHKDGSLWQETAKEKGLLEDFEQNRANSSSVVIDMGRQLCPDDRAYYNETLENRQAANLLRS